MEFVTATSFGPADILIGEQRSQAFNVAPGTTNVNTEESFFVVDAHRIDRSCVLPAAAAAPTPTTYPPPTRRGLPAPSPRSRGRRRTTS